MSPSERPSPPARLSLSRRLLRTLLFLLPADFRSRYRGEIEQVFVDELVTARTTGGPLGALRIWWSTLFGLLQSAPALHLERLLQDLSYAVRLLRRSPASSGVAILTLALGIGANTAVFSVVNSAYLQRLPFADDERLVRLFLSRGGQPPMISLGPELFLEIERAVRSGATPTLEDVVAQRFTHLSLGGSGGSERLAAMTVGPGWLRVLGLEPLLGRGFNPDEEEAGRDSGVALISHQLWSSRFGGEPEVLGRTLRLDGVPTTIVGVMPRGFRFPYDVDVWMPMNLSHGRRGLWGLNVQARLAPEADLEAAAADLARLARSLEPVLPEVLEGMDLVPVPTRLDLLGEDGGILISLTTAVGFVLLLVCINLGSLLLARSVGRREELSIRAALGASRGRRLRQLITESLFLAAIGGALGWLLALACQPLLTRLLPSRLQLVIGEPATDSKLLFFSLGSTLLAGLLFGLVPALRLSSVLDLRARASEGVSGQRLLRGLVIAEVALAVVILVAAGTTVRHYRDLAHRDLGYAADQLLAVSLFLDRPTGEQEVRGTRLDTVEAVVERLATIPGVESAAATCIFPSLRANFLARVAIQDRADLEDEDLLVHHRLVTPGFFDAMSIPVLRGRSFEARDRAGGEAVVVVSEGLAQRYWPNDTPLGKRLRRVSGSEETDWLTVVGVVGEVQESSRVAGTWYLPFAQHQESSAARQATFVVRASGEPQRLSSTVRHAVREVDPHLPLFDLAAVRDLYTRQLSEEQTGTFVMVFFASFALLLATLGIGAVTAYAVSSRTREIGVRRALGAEPSQILAAVMGEAGALAAYGALLGMVAAWGTTVLLGRLLTGIEGQGPASLAGLLGAALLAVATGVAVSLIPARRAARVPPVVALRSD